MAQSDLPYSNYFFSQTHILDIKKWNFFLVIMKHPACLGMGEKILFLLKINKTNLKNFYVQG